MPKRISVNVGFIPNSSSCIYYFPKEVLEDQEVKDFILKYELDGGWVGSNLWYRSECDSFLVSKDQKEEALHELVSEEYGGDRVKTAINPEDDGVYVIFGDEYHSTVHVLNGILKKALDRLQKDNPNLPGGYVTDYN